MLLYRLVEFHELHGGWCLSSLSHMGLWHVLDSLLPESYRFFMDLQLTWVYKILNSDLHPNTFSCMKYLHRIRQSSGSFLTVSCFLLCREFRICTKQSCPELWSRLKLFTQSVITRRCIKWDFYVIMLHEKSIVLVCLFRFIEQRGCVTAVTICGCVAAVWKFERLWTQVAICIQIDEHFHSLC